MRKGTTVRRGRGGGEEEVGKVREGKGGKEGKVKYLKTMIREPALPITCNLTVTHNYSRSVMSSGM